MRFTPTGTIIIQKSLKKGKGRQTKKRAVPEGIRVAKNAENML